MMSYAAIPQKRSSAQRLPKKIETLYDLAPTPQELESILGDSEETLDFYLSYSSENEKLGDIALLYKLRGNMNLFETYWQKISNPRLQRSLKEYSLRESKVL